MNLADLIEFAVNNKIRTVPREQYIGFTNLAGCSRKSDSPYVVSIGHFIFHAYRNSSSSSSSSNTAQVFIIGAGNPFIIRDTVYPTGETNGLDVSRKQLGAWDSAYREAVSELTELVRMKEVELRAEVTALQDAAIAAVQAHKLEVERLFTRMDIA